MSSHITARAARYFVAALFAASCLGTSAAVAASALSSSAAQPATHSVVVAATPNDGGNPWG